MLSKSIGLANPVFNMTTSAEKALPPMISNSDVVHEQQQTDLKEYRRYLIQSGAVKSLVKMYQHTLKHETRMDNPNVVSDYMNKYRDDSDPEVAEREQLVAENRELRQQNVALAQRHAQLEKEAETLHKRRSMAKSLEVLWDLLTSPEFWASQDGMDEEKAAALTDGITGAQLFVRLCGTFYDAKAGLDMMEFVRPKGLSPESMTATIDLESLTKFFVEEAHPDVFDWSESDLVPKLKESIKAPWETALADEIQRKVQEEALRPEDLHLVSTMVELDAGLRDFFESIMSFYLPKPDNDV